jgi:subfamily B ATP-binding cassette protein MsbA
LDAFSFLLVIPFLNVLLVDSAGPRPESISTGDALLDRVLNGTIGRMVDFRAAPEDAIQGIILFLLVVFAVKNVFDFLKTYLMARVQQGVTRDLRDRVYDHLLELDMAVSPMTWNSFGSWWRRSWGRSSRRSSSFSP